MAFNQAPFNQTSFDVGSTGVIWLEMLIQEKITAVVGTSQEIYISVPASERMISGGARGGNGIFISGEASEAVSDAEIIGEHSTMIGPITAAETVSGEAVCRSNTWLKAVAGIEIAADVKIGSVICVVGTAAEVITARAYTEKETWLIAAFYELMSGSASLEAVDIEVCELNLTLKPGQRLVVDAVNYNVLLDGQNYIWAQSGEWIDELSRDTSSISITAATGVGNLEASILYTERYL